MAIIRDHKLNRYMKHDDTPRSVKINGIGHIYDASLITSHYNQLLTPKTSWEELAIG